MEAGFLAYKSASKEQEEVEPAVWMASCSNDAWSWRRSSSVDISRTLDHSTPGMKERFGDTAGREGRYGRRSVKLETFVSFSFWSFCKKNSHSVRTKIEQRAIDTLMVERLHDYFPPPPDSNGVCSVPLCVRFRAFVVWRTKYSSTYLAISHYCESQLSCTLCLSACSRSPLDGLLSLPTIVDITTRASIIDS